MKNLIYLFFAIIITGCNVKPEPINYGVDGCDFCKMTIVDKIHAAEIVTKKGKVYKFDATECMINFIQEFKTSEVALFLTNDYNQPESLIDATSATFLISENIPSPMGAYLSAFKSEAEAKIIQDKKGGDLYTWDSLLVHLKD